MNMLEQLKISDPMDDVVYLQSDFLSSKLLDERKSLGQFFTGSIISDYMASLVKVSSKNTIRILDAGAGTGILTASTALHCLYSGCKAVHAVLYEIDSAAISNLEQTLKIIENIFEQEKSLFTYEIRCEDFILSRPDQDTSIQPFDVSVINPPYFKYNVKTSPYAKAVADLYHGDPNIYASFMAVAMACLCDDGQMVVISPRSFSNGLYFKGFRTYLLRESALDLIHIFKHRNKIFKNSDSKVLQENIICRFVKGQSAEIVTIKSSDCDISISSGEEQEYSMSLIVDPSNDQHFIRVPETSYEAALLKKAETLPATFSGAGYFISTGPVVEHRTRKYITEDTGKKHTVPLYRPHNVIPLTAEWTGDHKKEVSFKLDEGHEKHTIKNGTYVLLKRFSSKDEKRRLVSGVCIRSHHKCEFIGFGNKINYIGVVDETLSKVEAYGIAAVLNSSFMDRYFRCVSGNTQVNATEIRLMKFPCRKQVKEIGDQVMKLKLFSSEGIDSIVNSVLGTDDLA